MNTPALQEAIFGAGCFWGVEDLFRQVKGVKDAEVGYAGGHTENPTYEQVCTDTTGHAEVAKIIYNPEEVSYESLVREFFKMHDPTTLNRQGPDHGSQYRSIIFYGSPEEQATAEKVKEELDEKKIYPGKIVTEIVPTAPFYRAEEYHQQYFKKNGGGVCHV